MNARIPPQNNGQMGISPQMLQQGNQILQVLAQQGLTPEQAVRQMLQNGNLSQQDFERYRQQANQTTGMKL